MSRKKPPQCPPRDNPPRPGRPHRPGARTVTQPERRELKYYGAAACRALWQRRPQDVIRIYLEEARIPEFAPLLKWAAAHKKAYHLVSAADLERLTESVHHQGICLLAREALPFGFDDLTRLLAGEAGPQLLVYLDGVENPHNLGAILRSCAHFGVRHVLGAEGRLPRLSPSACRVAEGGAEEVALVYLDRPRRQLELLKGQGYSLLATAAERGESLYAQGLPGRTILALGAEVEGISAALLQAADRLIHVPGTGRVESLNVSVACAVVAAEFYRQHVAPSMRSGRRLR